MTTARYKHFLELESKVKYEAAHIESTLEQDMSDLDCHIVATFPHVFNGGDGGDFESIILDIVNSNGTKDLREIIKNLLKAIYPADKSIQIVVCQERNNIMAKIWWI